MPEGKRRVLDREFKVSVVERIFAGESGAALSRELLSAKVSLRSGAGISAGKGLTALGALGGLVRV